MTRTLADVRAEVQALGIVSTAWSGWDNTFLNRAIADGVLDYSRYFPRGPLAAKTTCTAGVRQYDLPASFRGVYQLEYPWGETPPRYCRKLDESDPDFTEGDYYNVRDILVLGRTPAAGDVYCLWYFYDHTAPTVDTDPITIPDAHIDILHAFVIWMAYQKRLTGEESLAQPDTIYIDTLRLNADKARAWYDALLRQAKRTGRGRIVRWARPND